MREILFRGKDLTGAWHYGVPLVFSEELVFITAPHENNRAVITETVGQYTGLTSNGTKIFEGDIVRADDFIFSIQYGKCGGTPNADNYGYMGFYLEAVSEETKFCAKYGLRDDMCFFTDIAVIGNIHDNPELLEGGME